METLLEKNPEFKQFSNLLDTARGSIEHLVTDETLIQARMTQLENLGIITATPYWRSKKYLYLIYPMVNGKRKREYIGADPEKISLALDGIARGKLHNDLAKQVKDIAHSLKEARNCLNNVIWSESESRGHSKPDEKKPGE